jgi:dethiobiotin synthetase
VRGLFVSGTDTGVGKTVLAAAIAAALSADGTPVRALKPVITGLAEPHDPDWPPDHELLARACGSTAAEVSAFGYGPAVSPHLAAELEQRPLMPAELVETVRAAAADGETVVVEGVGGLLVPLTDGYDVRALIAALELPLVVAARPGLGTINHALLTLEAAADAGIRVAGVVLTPWPASPGALERSNRATIARLGGVPVSTLGQIPRAERALLAAAGRSLPLAEWLSAALASAGSV